MTRTIGFCFAASVFALLGCQRVYYGTMEKLGYHKRDLLVERVEDARDAQGEAKEQFQSALDAFSEVLSFSGGELEDKYRQLKGQLEVSESKAKAMRTRINDVENVSEALFDEWKAELKQYSNDKLRRSSERRLEQTRLSYDQLIGAMKRAEAKIEPVLSAFRDHVLFLKHNLNARAVASLQDELLTIEDQVAVLVREMEASITEADQFIAEMTSPGEAGIE